MMEPNSKKTIIPLAVVITVLLAAFGWIFTCIHTNTSRIEANTASTADVKASISVMREEFKGEFKEIKETLKWLERVSEQYRKTNGQMNFEDFISELVKNNRESF